MDKAERTVAHAAPEEFATAATAYFREHEAAALAKRRVGQGEGACDCTSCDLYRRAQWAARLGLVDGMRVYVPALGRIGVVEGRDGELFRVTTPAVPQLDTAAHTASYWRSGLAPVTEASPPALDLDRLARAAMARANRRPVCGAPSPRGHVAWCARPYGHRGEHNPY